MEEEKIINNTLEEAHDDLQLPANDDYETLFHRGIEEYEAAKFEDASKTFKHIMDVFPERTEALVNYGNCQYELFNSDEAVNSWKKAVEKDKYLINPHINLGNYYYANNNITEAIKEFETAFCINPYNETALTNLAVAFEEKNDRKTAFLLYEFYLQNSMSISSSSYKNIHKKLSMHKLNAISYIKLGLFFEQKEYYRKSLQSYFESIRVFPLFAKPYLNIANIFYKLEKFDYAAKYWFEVFKMEKTNYDICLNLGLCYAKTEDKVNAYCFLSKYLQNTKIKNQKYNLASKTTETIKEQMLANPALKTEFVERAKKLYDAGKYKDALVMYENLLLLSPDNNIRKDLNDIKLKSNILYQASKTALDIAQAAYTKGDYETALEKCKISTSLWRNSFFEKELTTLTQKCQSIQGDNLTKLIKAKK